MTSTQQRFSPRRPASRARRSVALLLVGPLLWVTALEAVAIVVDRGNAVAVALLIAGASVAVALLALTALRTQRIREERAGAPGR